MPPSKKRYRKFQSAAKEENINRQHQAKCKKFWNKYIQDMSDTCVSVNNSKGKMRTFEENKLLVLAILSEFKNQVHLADVGAIEYSDITPTDVLNKVASDFKVRRTHLQELIDGIEGGFIIDFVSEKRGSGAPNAKTNSKLSNEQMILLLNHINNVHGKGKSTTRRRLKAWIKTSLHIDVTKQTVGNYMKKLGLSYRLTKPRHRTLQEYRLHLILEHLLGLNKYKTAMDNGEGYVLVYMDESYVHDTHSAKKSWVGEDNHINKSASKGKRLIIINAITAFGPLVERKDNGMPIDDLVWKKDNPTSRTKTDNVTEKNTTECLWVAQSKSGDYHSNMDSDWFMKWVEERLIPTFQRLHPGKKMVFIADNAPYHHKRKIGSLASKKKSELVALCLEFNIEYIVVPCSEERDDAYDDGEVDCVAFTGTGYRVDFDEDDFNKRKTKQNVWCPTVEELKLGIVDYLQENNPDALRCEVEQRFKELDWVLLWTPPYCPDLQPIEIFWAVGKNNVAANHYDKRSMKQTVYDLREGWYGTPPEDRDVNPDRPSVAAVRCDRLVAKSIKHANETFIPMCKDLGLSGTIGNLTYNPTNQDVGRTAGFPIDLVVQNITTLELDD